MKDLLKRNALLFTSRMESELSHKIMYFLKYRETAKEMGRITREKAVAHFALEKAIRKYVDLYESLLVQ